MAGEGTAREITPAQFDAVLARIQRLEDIEECRRLRNTYHRYINDGMYDRFGELFTEDAFVELDYMSRWRGRKAIADGFNGIPAMAISFIKQLIHNHIVDIDGDRGTGLAYFEARYGRGGTAMRVIGRYDDVYRRVEGRWLFEQVRVEMYMALPFDKDWGGEALHYMRPDGSLDGEGRAERARIEAEEDIA